MIMTGESGPVTRALLGLAGDGHSGGDRKLADRICQACVEGTGVDGAAVSLLTATVHRATLAATDETAERLEELQFTLGEGACMQAATSGRPVLVSDLHDHVLTSRWPMFAATVAEQTPVRALFAMPLQIGTINLGVLDLYRKVPGPLSGPELRDVAAAVDAATLLLLDAQTHSAVDEHPDGYPGGSPDGSPDIDAQRTGYLDGHRLDLLTNSRSEVHQATGMVLVQLGVAAQDAFVRLRAYAFAHQRPLSEVARDVVARRLVFTEDMD